jgi:RNA polymerase sigma-70 factor (ECF subfamily)
MDDAEARAVFDQIYEGHAKAVLGYALRRTSSDAAQDVVSETFLVTWRRLSDVPREPLPWLLGVARRVLANQRRGARRADALRIRLMHDEQVGLIDNLPALDLDSPVLKALSRLSDAERELLMLVAWEGLSTAQAGEVLSISSVAARVRLHRAKRRLRERLVLGDANESIALLQPPHPAKES